MAKFLLRMGYVMCCSTTSVRRTQRAVSNGIDVEPARANRPPLGSTFKKPGLINWKYVDLACKYRPASS